MKRGFLLTLPALLAVTFLVPGSASAWTLGAARKAAVSVPLEYACALKKNGSLRYVPALTECRKQENQVTVIGGTTHTCYQTTDGSIRKVASSAPADCPAPGTYLKLPPLNITQYFCADSDGRLKRVTSPSCGVGETLVESAATNHAPTDIALTNQSVAENAANATVGTLSTTDSDLPSDTHTYTLVAGAGSTDNAAFTITGNTLKVGATGLDYETPPSHTRSIRVQSSDQGNLTTEKVFVITITDVNEAPVADDETFNATDSAVGNTTLVGNDPSDAAPATADPTDTSPVTDRPHKTISADILAGDTDPEAGTLSVTAGTFATNDGGSVTIEADGDFTFEPKASTSCTDTSDFFDYTVTDNNNTVSPGTPLTDIGRVTIAITGCVWYVNNDDAQGDNGTSEKPYDTLAQAETASGTGHTIFVYDGNDTTLGYSNGINLKANQQLIGEAATLTVGSDTLHSADAANKPTLTDLNADVVDLDDGTTVKGFNIDPQGTGGGIAGSSGDTGGGTIDDVNIADTVVVGTQPGLELDSTTGTFNISNLTVNNGDTLSATTTDSGVRLNNAGTVNFLSTGTISITTNGAKGLDATSTNMGTSVFDDITVTNSGNGGVSLSSTTGTTTLGNGSGTDIDLTTTTGAPAALTVSNAGTVSVPGGGTANLNATGGPAADITGTSGATFDLDAVSSTNSANDGVNISGLGAGTFTAASGTIAGQSGIGFDLDGGSGAITYPGTFGNTAAGKTAEITNRSGGAVSFSGAINDTTANAGGGITMSGNSAGSTTFSNATKKLDTGASDAVTISMPNSSTHTVTFSNGGLDIDTTSGKGFEATGVDGNDGTVLVTGTGSTIDTGSGKGLNVSNVNVGASALAFQRISGNGANAGILLNNTGANSALTVSSTGAGACTNADTSGCSGGAILNTTGADDAGNTPVGTAVVLNNTKGVSLTRMRLANNTNYGMRANSVSGLTFNDSVVNGTNGDSAITSFKDSSLRFTEVTGAVSMVNTDVSGGFFSNLQFINTAGPAMTATMTGFDSLAMNQALGGDNAVLIEGTGTATTTVDWQNGSVTSARGSMFHFIGDGTGGASLTLKNDSFINSNPLTNQSTGGGGVSAVAGATGAATMDIQNNTIQNAKTNALTIIKSHDIGGASGSFSGTINNNTIGVAATANSGSSEGDGMEITNEGTGNMTLAVTNNHVHQINSSGFQFVAGAGIASSGQFNINFSGNSVDTPGTNPSITLLQGVRIDSGVTSGDAFQTCANFGANTITGSSDAANKDFRLVVNQNTTIRLPGYVGGSTDGAAVAAFVAGKVGGGAVGTAVANSPGIFTGTGASCP